MKIPKGTRVIGASYVTYDEYTLPDDINVEQIGRAWLKYGHLHLEMKDGTTHTIEGSADYSSTDWKYPMDDSIQYYDEEFNEVSE